MDYPTPLLNALPDGAVMDVRLKFAMELMKTPGFFRDATQYTLRDGSETHKIERTPPYLAEFALDTAASLFIQAAARGWIAPLPETPDLPAAELAHVRRHAAAQVHGQMHAQGVAQDSAPRVTDVFGRGVQ